MTNIRVYKLAKLVRDSSIANMSDRGAQVNWRALGEMAYQVELARKLVEESHELQTAQNVENIRDELVDVLQIVMSMAEVHNLTMDEIEAARKEKFNRRGAYAKRIYVETVACPEGSYWDTYFARNPEKFPVMDIQKS